MKETKHTPGPWRVNQRRIEYGPIVAGDGFAVATVMRDPCENGGGPTEWQANACLIAAAPDLLRELQSFVHRFGDFPKPPAGRDLEIYLDAARAAIAKATT